MANNYGAYSFGGVPSNEFGKLNDYYPTHDNQIESPWGISQHRSSTNPFPKENYNFPYFFNQPNYSWSSNRSSASRVFHGQPDIQAQTKIQGHFLTAYDQFQRPSNVNSIKSSPRRIGSSTDLYIKHQMFPEQTAHFIDYQGFRGEVAEPEGSWQTYSQMGSPTILVDGGITHPSPHIPTPVDGAQANKISPQLGLMKEEVVLETYPPIPNKRPRSPYAVRLERWMSMDSDDDEFCYVDGSRYFGPQFEDFAKKSKRYKDEKRRNDAMIRVAHIEEKRRRDDEIAASAREKLREERDHQYQEDIQC